MSYILTAPLIGPRLHGYEEIFQDLSTVRLKAAELIGCKWSEMIEVGPFDTGCCFTTYCYASQADADHDLDGKYAVQYRTLRYHRKPHHILHEEKWFQDNDYRKHQAIDED